MTVETQNPNLPEGWTYHELSGRPFWYHAASNTIQQEPPAPPPPPPVLRNVIAPTQQVIAPTQQVVQVSGAPQSFHHLASPIASAGMQATAQTIVQPVHSDAAFYPCSPQVVHVSGGPPMAVPGHVTLCPPHSAFQNTPLPAQQAVQVRGGPPKAVPGHAAPLAAQAMQAALQPNAQLNALASPQLESPISANQSEQHMVNLQVLVPDPGLHAGQQLAFIAPPQCPGQSPQPMVVTVNQEVFPGSVITVKYPAPSTSASARLPQPFVQASTSTDSTCMKYTWMLYGAGCLAFCCFGPIGMVVWVVASCLYFCKPAQERAQMPRTRISAFVAVHTAFFCWFIFALASLHYLDFGLNDNTPFHHGPLGHFRGARRDPQQLRTSFSRAGQRTSQNYLQSSFHNQSSGVRPWQYGPNYAKEAKWVEEAAVKPDVEPAHLDKFILKD